MTMIDHERCGEVSGYIYADCGCSVLAHPEGECKSPARANFTADRTIPVYVAPGYDNLFQILNAALSRPADTPDPDAPIGALVGLALTQAVEACTLTTKGNYPDAMTSILKAIHTLSDVAIKIDQRGVDAGKD
jgi:hypothetical protein